MRIIISDMTNANTTAARLDAAIAYWLTLTPRLDGERRLIERTVADLRARRAALG
jgi:hypothetical protein